MSDMTLSIIVFIVSVALLMFYFQAECQRILLRRLNQQFFHSVVEAYRLEFPFVRKAVEDFGVPVDYKRLRMELKCEFLALTYLLKDTGNTVLTYLLKDAGNAKGFSAKEYFGLGRALQGNRRPLGPCVAARHPRVGARTPHRTPEWICASFAKLDSFTTTFLPIGF